MFDIFSRQMSIISSDATPKLSPRENTLGALQGRKVFFRVVFQGCDRLKVEKKNI